VHNWKKEEEKQNADLDSKNDSPQSEVTQLQLEESWR
jgi:hypothetical protein